MSELLFYQADISSKEHGSIYEIDYSPSSLGAGKGSIFLGGDDPVINERNYLISANLMKLIQ